MRDTTSLPCYEWEELLSFSADDLSDADYTALNAHLASCPTCLKVRIDDKMIGRLLNQLPPPDFGESLPVRLQQLLKEDPLEKRQEEASGTYPSQSVVKDLPAKNTTQTDPPSPLLPQKEGERVWVDKTLQCRDCGNDFIFTAGEQEFYDQKGLLNQPSRCSSCRQLRRAAAGSGRHSQNAPKEMHTFFCPKCETKIQVPFLPGNGRPIQCPLCQGDIKDQNHLGVQRRDS